MARLNSCIYEHYKVIQQKSKQIGWDTVEKKERGSTILGRSRKKSKKNGHCKHLRSSL